MSIVFGSIKKLIFLSTVFYQQGVICFFPPPCWAFFRSGACPKWQKTNYWKIINLKGEKVKQKGRIYLSFWQASNVHAAVTMYGPSYGRGASSRVISPKWKKHFSRTPNDLDKFQSPAATTWITARCDVAATLQRRYVNQTTPFLKPNQPSKTSLSPSRTSRSIYFPSAFPHSISSWALFSRWKINKYPLLFIFVGNVSEGTGRSARKARISFSRIKGKIFYSVYKVKEPLRNRRFRVCRFRSKYPPKGILFRWRQ